MSVPFAWPEVLDFFGTPLILEPSPGQLSGDAGLLPVRQFDERIGLTRPTPRPWTVPAAPASRGTASPRVPAPASLASSPSRSRERE
jgi:hypothetical protein